MSGMGRRFDPAEVRPDAGPGPSDAELAEAMVAARELEALGARDAAGPTAGFEDRVMAAIATEPPPRVLARPGGTCATGCWVASSSRSATRGGWRPVAAGRGHPGPGPGLRPARGPRDRLPLRLRGRRRVEPPEPRPTADAQPPDPVREPGSALAFDSAVYGPPPRRPRRPEQSDGRTGPGRRTGHDRRTDRHGRAGRDRRGERDAQDGEDPEADEDPEGHRDARTRRDRRGRSRPRHGGATAWR